MVYSQHIDSTGEKLWGENGIEIPIPGRYKSPLSACSDGDGGCYVFLTSDPDTNMVFELRTQHIDKSGNLLWGNDGIILTEDLRSLTLPNPAVSDGAGGAIVLYSDSTGAKLQRINNDGQFLWG